MGVTGLLPFVKAASCNKHLSELRGQTAAVDTYCWLHKGAFGCADKLGKGEFTLAYVTYCLRYITLLQQFNIKPIMVFDGRYLPAKAEIEVKRRQSREQAKKRAVEALSLGKLEEARTCFQRCVDVTPEMAYELIKECRKRKIDYIVAPYEADPQLAFLNRSKIADFVISEDSDLLTFGCERVLFKLGLTGVGTLVEANKLFLATQERPEDFTLTRFRHLCILSGCDYVESLPGIGLKRALKFLKAFYQSSLEHALPKLPATLKMQHLTITRDYIDNVLTAEATFKHQYIFNPITRTLEPLFAMDLYFNSQYCRNAGTDFGSKLAFHLAIGNINPLTMHVLDQWTPTSDNTCPSSIWSNVPKRKYSNKPATVTASTFFSKPFASRSFSEPLASTSFSEPLASTSFSKTVASTSFSQPLASTSFSNTGTSASFSTAVASTPFSTAVPSTFLSKPLAQKMPSTKCESVLLSPTPVEYRLYDCQIEDTVVTFYAVSHSPPPPKRPCVNTRKDDGMSPVLSCRRSIINPFVRNSNAKRYITFDNIEKASTSSTNPNEDCSETSAKPENSKASSIISIEDTARALSEIKQQYQILEMHKNSIRNQPKPSTSTCASPPKDLNLLNVRIKTATKPRSEMTENDESLNDVTHSCSHTSTNVDCSGCSQMKSQPKQCQENTYSCSQSDITVIRFCPPKIVPSVKIRKISDGNNASQFKIVNSLQDTNQSQTVPIRNIVSINVVDGKGGTIENDTVKKEQNTELNNVESHEIGQLRNYYPQYMDVRSSTSAQAKLYEIKEEKEEEDKELIGIPTLPCTVMKQSTKSKSKKDSKKVKNRKPSANQPTLNFFGFK